jgi:sialate O-acetylesterase
MPYFLKAAGTTCNIVITDGLSDPLALNAVLFGDVWLCSGQSNMEWSMSRIFNSTEEIAASAGYDQIRFMMTSHATSDGVEMADNKPALGWSRPADAAALGRMSAVCFLHARYVYDVTGIPQVSRVWLTLPQELMNNKILYFTNQLFHCIVFMDSHQLL